MSEITTVARPYAKAIFESAVEQKTLKDWTNALKKLALIVSDKAVQSVLTNPKLTKEEISQFMIEMTSDTLNDAAKRLIHLLASRKRLNLLPAIEKLYASYVADLERTIEVKVTSAYPLDNSRLQRMRAALENKLKRQVTLRCLVDKALLGGAIIHAGDQVIDGSLRSKLERLSERLCS